MVKSFVRASIEPMLIVAGIIFISATSGLFKTQSLSFLTYWEELINVIKNLSAPQELVYTNPVSGEERDLFPIILLAFVNSGKIFFLALLLSIISSILMLIIYSSAGKIVKGIMKNVSLVLGALPDIFIISILQIFVIWFYKQSGILLVEVASLGENQLILFPAVVLSILPTFFFLESMISFLKEEIHLSYVDLARSKGLAKYKILFVHMMRNIIISLIYHGKQIGWMMLSNLLILEYLFNVFGVTSFLFTYNEPSIFAVTAILLFLPIYTCLKSLQFYISKKIGKAISL
ncbi:ABC transporter permease subunit [Bacillus spongiae]|uniref:ABC transporter permease subunit n=1 Tax=Bacillus spongiae TaxID=2683610 RepID=A0ABU8HKT9_9BACI